jgi:hypothetical protein
MQFQFRRRATKHKNYSNQSRLQSQTVNLAIGDSTAALYLKDVAWRLLSVHVNACSNGMNLSV